MPEAEHLLEQLSSKNRSTLDAIVARSLEEAPSAQALQTALALLHLRAPGASAHLLTTLERTTVHVLLGDPEDWQTLLIFDTADSQPHLGVFTSEAQVAIARQEYGTHLHDLAVDTALLCKSVSGNIGLALNPHDDILSFELSPAIFAGFRQAMDEKAAPDVGSAYSVLSKDHSYHAAIIQGQSGDVLSLSWIETAWPIRPITILQPKLLQHPQHPVEASIKAFQRWLPIRFTLEA